MRDYFYKQFERARLHFGKFGNFGKQTVNRAWHLAKRINFKKFKRQSKRK